MDKEEYILFSPIGFTDPIRGYRDGGMLHIARVYKPKKIYLYLTGEIVSKHKEDNRYLLALKNIGYEEKDIQIIETDIKDADNYEIFYNEFSKLLDKIQKKHKEETLLVNLSSGTTQIKNCLYNLILPNSIAVQVRSPKNASNDVTANNSESYYVEDEIENNEDNNSNFENRCKVAERVNLKLMYAKKDIKTLVSKYEYIAALQLANQNKPFIDNEVIELLQLASFKINFNVVEARKFVSKKNSFKKYMPMNCDEVLEFITNIEIKLKKGQYSDFARSITPIADEIFSQYIKKILKFNYDKYTYRDERGRKKIDCFQFDDDIKKSIKEEFTSIIKTDYSYATLYHIINAKSDDEKIKKYAKTIKVFTKKIRNEVAHNIQYVDEDIIKQKTSCDINCVLSALKNMYLVINKLEDSDNECFKSYLKLNEQINEKLGQ